ncbi:MAG: hypothetical protein H7293_04505 [Candidatus Saccharibacteria bacterium]|nr:hypothetical protein [Rhodoferax sp.]
MESRWSVRELHHQIERKAFERTELAALQAPVSKGLKFSVALSAVQKERDALANELAQAKRDRVAAAELAEAKLESKDVVRTCVLPTTRRKT